MDSSSAAAAFNELARALVGSAKNKPRACKKARISTRQMKRIQYSEIAVAHSQKTWPSDKTQTGITKSFSWQLQYGRN